MRPPWTILHAGLPAKPSRGRRVLTITAITAGAIVVGSLIAADLVGSAAGCGSIDPTDPSNYSTATVINDTPKRVTISDCHGSYCGPQPTATLDSNGHALVDGACGTSGQNMTTWKVSSAGGQLLGYIVIDTPRSTHNLIYNVTRASRDRLTPTMPS